MKTPSAELVGRTFGRLTVERVVSGQLVECSCTCGGSRRAYVSELVGGKQYVSCGCGQRTGKTTHGHASGHVHSITYKSYKNARSRCRNPRDAGYARYGGRGIEFRFDSFVAFLAEVGERPSPDYTIDRKDNDGHYEVGNVKWSTMGEQSSNQRRNVYIVHNGISRNIRDWSIASGTPFGAIRYRNKQGWCAACSIYNKPTDRCIHIS